MTGTDAQRVGRHVVKAMTKLDASKWQAFGCIKQTHTCEQELPNKQELNNEL